MLLTLTDIRRIATDVARENRSHLDVLAAKKAGSESEYAEVMLENRECPQPPCLVVVGVDRNSTEEECRTAIQASLRRQAAA